MFPEKAHLQIFPPLYTFLNDFNTSLSLIPLRNQFGACFHSRKGNTKYTFQHVNGNAILRALHLERKKLRGVAKLEGALQILTF